jgi:hypothetical protein
LEPSDQSLGSFLRQSKQAKGKSCFFSAFQSDLLLF